MKKIISVIFLILLIMCGCSDEVTMNDSLSLNEQTIEQLQLETTAEEEKYNPLNFENQKALWFTMEDFRKALENKSREEFDTYISEVVTKIKDNGFNTIYFHVRPYNDAYYKSEIFPPSNGWNGEYDPLEAVLEKAHGQNMSVHAWVNPMRCQTTEEFENLDDKYKIKEWYQSKQEYISEANGRWYLNPAYEEVRKYISDGVSELVQNYTVDGIHIDDYFYPTQDESFDKTAFEQSGSEDVSDWRRENINLMVKSIYEAVKKENDKVLFGISPQGNIEINRNNLYANVLKWCGEKGYCDYIVPQLYYGFQNESKPFKETLLNWKEIVTEETVYLAAGVCTYKIGMEDKWAGTGKNEWIEDKNIPSRQVEFALDNGCGVAVYSFESLFDEKNSYELELISEHLKE